MSWIIISTLIAATMLTLGGCTMEEIGGGLEQVLIDAPKIHAELAEDVQTRTCIDAGTLGEGESAAVLWMPGDSLGVFSSGGSANVRYVNDETEVNVANASFSAAEAVSGEIQYAYYPYSSENDGREATSLVGTLPGKQVMGGALSGDYKYGELRSRDEDGGYRFKFHNLFSMVRFKVDVTGSKLEGKVLEKITLKVTREGSTVPAVTGDFTFSATDGSYTLGETSNMLSTIWNKELEAEFSDFATVFPEIKEGDKLTFTLSTGESNTVFSVTSKVDFQPGTYYTFPLKLAVFEKNPTKYGYAEKARPTITGFKFEVAKNSGKLLNNQTVWSSNKPKFSEVKEHAATISGTSVDVMIPYLYDFTLVPTFTAGGTVTVGSQALTSGSTAVNFTGPVTMTVNTEEEARDYTVNVTNTGLPVVVLKQSGSGDFSKKYDGGFDLFGTHIGGTLLNEFVDFMVRGKDTEDWAEDDEITVYNPDGSIDLPTALCGTKLRGNTSQEYPKKPFAIKMVKKQSIFGLPAHKRWVLLANWLDHSMIRNTVAFDIAHAIEKAWKTGAIEPGIPWNVHGKNVELVFVESDGTGHHVGNYFLCEQIKIDKNRLAINDPYEDVVEDGNANPGIADCGYLLEVDNNYDETYKFKTSRSVPFMFKDEVSDAILSAVKTKVQGIETNLYNSKFTTAYNDLDINSVIDQMLIWELTMNREYGDPRSVYYFMDGNGKLSAGPVWDFDRGTFQNPDRAEDLGNTSSYRKKPYNEWMYWRSAESDSDSYIWYRQLAKDPTFVATVQARWAVIYPQLKFVSGQIREYGRTMRASFESDSGMWPTTESAIHAYKSDFKDWSGDEDINDWDELIENFVTVYEARLEGMNGLITSGNFVK
ncbi:MAG: CotH kinase family protein [Bacteroidales bacterium]|nr:CotH kinase family protein [Bacteroidales bacterium]